MLTFKDLPKLDTHVHINHFNPAMIENAIRNNIKYLSINVDVDEYPPIPEQEEIIIRLKKDFGNSINYAASFEAAGWEDPKWTGRTLDEIKKSLDRGAVGVKVWKNIGMTLRDKTGNYVMVDDPSLDPIYDFLAANDVTLLGHIGEPKNCWLPLGEMTVASDRDYFSKNPDFHMYLHPEMPSYQSQLDARNNMLTKHPGLKFVGLHLTCQEWSTGEIGKFLDRFPNAAVDLAERVCHLQYQALTDWKKVYDFLINYQDRIIYGTDLQYFKSTVTGKLIKEMDNRYAMHWQFFTSGETMTAPKVSGEFNGMKLPDEVIQKIYFENAKRWYKGFD